MVVWLWYECGAEREMRKPDFATAARNVRDVAECIADFSRAIITSYSFPGPMLSLPSVTSREEVLDEQVNLDLQSPQARASTLSPDVFRNEGHGVLVSDLIGEGPYLAGRIDTAIEAIGEALGDERSNSRTGTDDP